MTYYGVWKGHKTGVFTSWAECQEQTKGFKGAQFKKLSAKTLVLAEKEFSKGYESAKSPNKKSETKHVVRDLHLNKGINFFCDGACPKNPGASGSGVAIFKDGELKKLYYGEYVEEGSNNISELEAVYFCLSKIKEINRPSTIYIDSQYAINAVSLWAYNWSKNNWMTKDKKDVKNKDLVEKCFNLYKSIKHITTLEKVKSHIGEVGNELADRMAIHSVKEKSKEWLSYDNHNINKILEIKY